MAKVICTHPNASNLINGIKFEDHPDGKVSEEVSDEQAEAFLSVPDFRLFDAKASASPVKPPPAAGEPDKKAASVDSPTF